MKRRLFLVLTPVLLVLLVAAAVLDPNRTILGLARGEAFFRGRPASVWADTFEQEMQSGELSASTVDLFDLDPRAVPVLEQCLDDSSEDIRCAAARLLQLCGGYREQVSAFRRLLDDPSDEVRIAAIIGLGNLRREAIAALPQLEKLAQSADERIALAARFSLWNIDEVAACRAEKWQDHEYKELGFTVRFPGQVHTDQRRAKYIDSDLHECWAKIGYGRLTVVLTFVLPDARGSVEERYDQAPAWAAENLGGTVDANDRITNGSFIGRDQRITTAEGFILRTHMFVVDDRVYQAQAVYKSNTVHPAAVEHFLNSFRILDKPAETHEA